MAVGDPSTGGDAVKAGLVILGFVLAKEAVDLLKRPSYGPRLKPGEVTGARASELAAKAYWRAEQAAYEGQCRAAKLAFEGGEKRRHDLEERAAHGDETSRDVRQSYRAARKAIRRCVEGRV